MAKKTAPKKTAPKKTSPVKKAAAKKPTAAKAASKAAPTAKTAIDDSTIGAAAGTVWGRLHDDGPQTLAAIKKAVDAPSDVTLMAIGWLAREGKLEFLTSGRSAKIGLR